MLAARYCHMTTLTKNFLQEYQRLAAAEMMRVGRADNQVLLLSSNPPWSQHVWLIVHDSHRNLKTSRPAS